MEERPWPEWRDRLPMTPRQMAIILHRFGISPVKWRQDAETLRGYQRTDFADAFSRYLPPDPPQAPHASLQSTYDQSLSATKVAENADLHDSKSSIISPVADVADGKSENSKESATT